MSEIECNNCFGTHPNMETYEECKNSAKAFISDGLNQFAVLEKVIALADLIYDATSSPPQICTAVYELFCLIGVSRNDLLSVTTTSRQIALGLRYFESQKGLSFTGSKDADLIRMIMKYQVGTFPGGEDIPELRSVLCQIVERFPEYLRNKDLVVILMMMPAIIRDMPYDYEEIYPWDGL